MNPKTKKKTAKKNVKKQGPPPHMVIQNSTLTGIQFDGDAIGAIDTIAEGLLQNATALAENAKGLRELAKTFTGHSVVMIQVGGE